MKLIPYVGGWIVLAVVVLALALYRKFVSSHEADNYVHISEGESRLIPHQVAVNRTMDKIDHWGEILTIVTVVGGICLAFLYLYSVLYA